ncbi:MAG: uroporphyrinogen decarboxylase family protein [Nitrososphaeraceae archaeon]
MRTINLINSLDIEKIFNILPIKDWQNLKVTSKKRTTFEAQSNNHTIKLLGIDSSRFINDSELFVKSQLIISAYYGLDKPCIDYDFYNIECEALGQEMIYREGLLPEINFVNPLITEKRDLYRLKSQVSKNKERFDFVLGLNKLFRSITGITPRIRFCGPYSIAASLRGYNNLMIDMEDDKRFVKDLFDFLTDDVIIPWVQLQRKDIGEPSAPAGGVEAIATFPNISTRTMDEWIIPYYEYTKQKIENVTFTTCCGGISYFKNPEDFFFYQLATCPGIIKGYQWDIKSSGFKVFNDYAKKNNLNLRLAISAQTLLSINKNEAVELVKRYLTEGGVGLKNYTIFISDIDPNTNPEIVCSISTAVKQLGIFPINEEIEYSFLPPKFLSLNDWYFSQLS